MATTTLHYPPSDTQTHSPGVFSPIFHNYAGSTYSESTQSGPTSPLKYTPARTLPPPTDSLITPNVETQPSLTARLHRRKKTYQPPTAPPNHASQPHDPLRAARLAWRLQEEYSEQLRNEEAEMKRSSASFQRQQREYGRSASAPAPSAGGRTRTRKKGVKSRWQAFCLWVSLEFYRFTRSIRNIFK
jgi:hypothetical protein